MSTSPGTHWKEKLGQQLADWSARTPEQKEALRIVRLRIDQLDKTYAANLVTYGKLIESVAPDLVLLLEDTIGPQSPVMIRAAHENNIPAVILPYTIADQTEALEGLVGNPRFHLRQNFNWLGLFHSWKYVRFHKGTGLLRLPYPMARAHQHAGYAPPDPWLLNSGEADAILAESPRIIEYYRERGFPGEQLRLAGAPYEDKMFHIRQARDRLYPELCARHGLDPDKPLIVLSAPPNQLISGKSESAYEDFETLCADLCAALRDHAASHNVLVCMHPNFRDQSHLFTSRGLAVHEGDMMELVPLARLFIAFASATLRWAIACGVPAINYDVFRYNYTEFDPAGGVLRVDDKAVFETLLEKLCTDEAYYSQIASKQAEARQNWSMADGNVMSRMRFVFEELIAQRSGSQTDLSKRPLKALYFIIRSSDCAEGLRSAIALRDEADIEPVFTFGRATKPDAPTCRDDVLRCEREGVACVTLRGEPFDYSAAPDS